MTIIYSGITTSFNLMILTQIHNQTILYNINNNDNNNNNNEQLQALSQNHNCFIKQL